MIIRRGFERVLTERVGGFAWNVNSVERDSVCVPIDDVLTVANEAYESDGFERIRLRASRKGMLRVYFSLMISCSC